RLQSIPGVGKVLALVLLYEIHDIARFAEVGQLLSYARLVRRTHESAGKKQGTGGNKIGNAHLTGLKKEPRGSQDGQEPPASQETSKDLRGTQEECLGPTGPTAALRPSYPLTGTACGRDPA